MDKASQLVIGCTVEVTEILATKRCLEREPLGDVSFRVDVERSIVLLCRRAVWETTETV